MTRDRPQLLRDPNEVLRREMEIDLPHVAPLNNWVRSLRSRLGRDAIVPWFDPRDGGCEAQILWLLEAPGAESDTRTGWQRLYLMQQQRYFCEEYLGNKRGRRRPSESGSPLECHPLLHRYGDQDPRFRPQRYRSGWSAAVRTSDASPSASRRDAWRQRSEESVAALRPDRQHIPHHRVSTSIANKSQYTPR